jgi:hypothetical protein
VSVPIYIYAQFDNQQQFSGMARRMEIIDFLNDLAPSVDILEEFSTLSNALQLRITPS